MHTQPGHPAFKMHCSVQLLALYTADSLGRRKQFLIERMLATNCKGATALSSRKKGADVFCEANEKCLHGRNSATTAGLSREKTHCRLGRGCGRGVS